LSRGFSSFLESFYAADPLIRTIEELGYYFRVVVLVKVLATLSPS
jgi:hypothetical protein